MYKLLRLLVVACGAVALSGCMALAVAPLIPVVNSFSDKPAALDYTTGAKAPQVFNAALKVLSAKGSTTTVDRETGVIRGTIIVSMGQSAYSVVINVDDQKGQTRLRVSAKLEGMVRYGSTNASDIAGDLALETEKQLGAKLNKV